MIKMMTGWLPVKHHLNKMSTESSHCHLCKNDETVAHLFQCQQRKQWQRQLYVQLGQYLNKIHTPTSVCQLITHHVKNIIQNTDDYSHFKHFTIFAGLLPRKWKIEFADTTNCTSMQSDTWLKQLGQWLLTQGHELWIQRNNSLHEKEKKRSTMEHHLNQKIRSLYTLQNEIGYHDRAIFETPIEERLNLSHHQKMIWIETTTKTMKVSMEEFQNKKTTGQQDIRQFFTKRTQSH